MQCRCVCVSEQADSTKDSLKALNDEIVQFFVNAPATPFSSEGVLVPFGFGNLPPPTLETGLVRTIYRLHTSRLSPLSSVMR